MTREEAIKWLENLKERIGQSRFQALWDFAQALDEIIEFLEALQERPKGQWIFKRGCYEADECNCSLCGQVLTTHKGERKNFCPNCGADMRNNEE